MDADFIFDVLFILAIVNHCSLLIYRMAVIGTSSISITSRNKEGRGNQFQDETISH